MNYVGINNIANNEKWQDNGYIEIETVPLYIVRSGGVNYGRDVYGKTSHGILWSMTAENQINAYALYNSHSGIRTAYSYDRYYGYPVRYIAAPCIHLWPVL